MVIWGADTAVPEARRHARQRTSPYQRCSRPVPLPTPVDHSRWHVTEQPMRQLMSVATDHSARVMSKRGAAGLRPMARCGRKSRISGCPG